ncbi:hypothetical protein [Streptomyces californicus]
MENWTSTLQLESGVQRIVVVALGSLPLLLISLAVVPAVLVLPFCGAAGGRRVQEIVQQLIVWNRALLTASRRNG